MIFCKGYNFNALGDVSGCAVKKAVSNQIPMLLSYYICIAQALKNMYLYLQNSLL
jgi:hypothetical protein